MDATEQRIQNVYAFRSEYPKRSCTCCQRDRVCQRVVLSIPSLKRGELNLFISGYNVQHTEILNYNHVQ